MSGEESKREKFVRVAEARTNKIIKMIQLLGNCSNTSVYEYTPSDIEKIFHALEIELKDARKKYENVVSKKSSRFSLE